MKAIVMTAVKEPFEIKEVADPQPGPGQIRIRLRASGVCGTDVHVWHGELPVLLPITPGHEPVGVVDIVGEGVQMPRVGDRVGVSWFQGGCRTCLYCQKRQPKFCAEAKTWITNGGAFAECMIAEAEGALLLPDELAWESAAPLFCGGYTAMSAYRIARPLAGERVAIMGIGGLGHLAIQIAKAMGHEVIAITNSEDKRADAMALGSDEVLAIKDHVGKQLANMGGADIILSFSPAMKQNNQAFEGLRPNGRFVTTAASLERIDADPISMLFKQTSIIGSAHNGVADLVDVLQLAAKGKVKPIIETYVLDDVNHVMNRLAEGKVRHRAVMLQSAAAQS